MFDNVLDPGSYETYASGEKRRASDSDVDTQIDNGLEDRDGKYQRRDAGQFQRRRRNRCFDYDEKGGMCIEVNSCLVCLRGDACPYEHGSDRIVVDEALLQQGFTMPDGLDNNV